jgi:hypothetical protein
MNAINAINALNATKQDPNRARSLRPSTTVGSPRIAGLVTGCLLAGWLLAGCTARSDASGTLPPLASVSGSASWSVASPGPAAATGSGADAGPAPVFGPGSSQSAAQAARDGVPAGVAALAGRARIHQVVPAHGGEPTRAATSEGVWLVSRPSVPDRAAQRDGGYSELLLLDPSGTRIRAAFPFTGLAPQWLLVTPAAIYCGRHGQVGSPDAMVCRVDRASRQLRVRVFADRLADAATTPSDVAGRPGRWAIDDQHLAADFSRPPQLRPTELVFGTASGAQPLQLDPETLQVIGS